MCKGGQLFPLWKGTGSWSDPTKYRGIVLLSVLGKRWHALLRQRILPFAEAHRLPTQFGGFPGQQPGFATSTVRTFANICRAHNLCDACIYFDLRSGFHHLLRQFAMDLQDPKFPHPLQEVLDQDGFSLEELCNRAADSDQLGKLPLPDHLNQMLSDLHQFTWFSIKGDGEPVWTHRGTRPGSPYADLGFNAFMGQLMVGIQEMLHHHRCFEEACNITGLEPVVVGWVDDIAIPLAALNPTDLCDLIKTVTEQVLLTMHRAGLQINMDRGKTECIATFRGRGAPSMRKQVFIDDKGTLPVVVEKNKGQPAEYDLHLVGKYVHLGTCMAQEQNFDLEIKRRIGIAQSAFRLLARPVFKNRRISCASRLQLLESLVCTKLFYNTGPWPQLRPGRMRKLEHAVISWQRQIIGAGFWKEDRTTDADLQRQWLLPTIGVRFAVTRLRFALAAFKSARDTVWTLLRLEAKTGQSSWMDLLASALRWFGAILPTWVPEEVDLQSLTADQIETWFKVSRCPTKAAIRRCSKKHLLQEQLIGEVRSNYIRVSNLFAETGRVAQTYDAPHPKGGRFVCSECPAVFQRAQQLQAHRWAKHSQISFERQYADGATCRACGCHFWTVQRVQQHLRQSRDQPDGCLAKLFHYVPPYMEPQPAALPAHLQHVRRLSTIQITQPLVVDGPTLHEERQQEEWAKWCERWGQLGLPIDPPLEFGQQCTEEFNQCTQAWVNRDPSDRDSIFDDWVAAMKRVADMQHCGDNMME